ncbi:putative ACYL-COA SYNTHETASE ligase PROTEIN similar to alkK [Balamuthia mandrillaris]
MRAARRQAEGVALPGGMMDFQLTLHHLFQKNCQLHARQEVVSVMRGGRLHRYTYAQFQRNVLLLAKALVHRFGVRRGDRVATFAYNHYQHLELYFAIPLIGAVLHTVNIRLFSEQLVYIFNHAEDRLLFIDSTLLPIIEPLKPSLPHLKHCVVLDSPPPSSSSLSPESCISSPMASSYLTFMSYEQLIAEAAADPVAFQLPDDIKEEEALGLCYTSGTTGNPKGVLYSHRSTFIQALVTTSIDAYAISGRDTLLSVVPMFHANAWSFPFVGVLVGTKLVLPGEDLSPTNIARLLFQEKCTLAAGVPTIWLGVLQHLKEKNNITPDLLSHLRIITGGSAAPPSLIQAYDGLGATMVHAWGMTELSPHGTLACLKPGMHALSYQDKLKFRSKQGPAVPTVEMRIVGDDSKELPWDGVTVGEVQVRGPSIAKHYFNDEGASKGVFTADGWFKTGDVGTIDEEGFMQIVDRTKDLIKSGGEWISSVELENAIMAHPKVQEAAAIAVFHPKWRERPMAVVKLSDGRVPQTKEEAARLKEDIRQFLAQKVAKWWIPEEIAFVEEIAKTSVGKFDKKTLRKQFDTSSDITKAAL